MTDIQSIGLVSVLAISLLSLVGIGTLSLKQTLVQRMTFLLISLAAGTLIGDVFLHILPELAEGWSSSESWGLTVIAGIIFFFILEKMLHWHHHHHVDAQTEHAHDHDGKVVGWVNLAADGLHNFIDGLVLAAAFSAGLEIGLATAVAIALHEIPQEIGDFGVLIHTGFTRIRALQFNFLSALFSVVGYLVATFLTGTVLNEQYLLAFAAGGFVYVAVADLLPQLHTDNRWKASLLQLALVLVGIAVMWALTLFEA
jgi:zinc and cadmium transporter